MHETLMTTEEGMKCYLIGDELPEHYLIYPSTNPITRHREAFTSENAERLTKEEFLEMLGE